MPRYIGVIYIHRLGLFVPVDRLVVKAGNTLDFDLLDAISGDPIGDFSLVEGEFPNYASIMGTELTLAPPADTEPVSDDISVEMAGITGTIPYQVIAPAVYWGTGDGDFWGSGDGDLWVNADC